MLLVKCEKDSLKPLLIQGVEGFSKANIFHIVLSLMLLSSCLSFISLDLLLNEEFAHCASLWTESHGDLGTSY